MALSSSEGYPVGPDIQLNFQKEASDPLKLRAHVLLTMKQSAYSSEALYTVADVARENRPGIGIVWEVNMHSATDITLEQASNLTLTRFVGTVHGQMHGFEVAGWF